MNMAISNKSVSEIVADLRVRHLAETARLVAAEHGVTLAEMLGRRHVTQYARARQKLWAIAYEQIPSLMVLGDIFDRDHTTILAGIRAHRARVLLENTPCVASS